MLVNEVTWRRIIPILWQLLSFAVCFHSSHSTQLDNPGFSPSFGIAAGEWCCTEICLLFMYTK